IGSAAFGLSMLVWVSAVLVARTKYRLQGAQIGREDLRKDPIVGGAEFLAIVAICIGITLFYTSAIVIDIEQDRSNVLWVISQPFFIPIACVAAISFYLARCRAQKIYGLTEISVGIFSISLASASQASPSDAIGKILAILGGVYIIVRGLDNIDKALTN